MNPPDIRRLLSFALALFVPVALAQGAADAAVPAPKAGAPATETSLQFNSTFSGYRAYTEQAVGSWREANDEVGRIGGWRAYAKEAAPAAVGTGGAADVASPGTKSGHEHHGAPAGKP